MPFALQYKPGPRSRFKDYEFWAEGGLICMENRNTGEFKSISRAEAAARAIAFNAELYYMDYYPDERNELSRCVRELAEAIKEAKRQGDPDDINVRKERLKSLHKVSLLLNSASRPCTPPPLLICGSYAKVPTHQLASSRFRKLRL